MAEDNVADMGAVFDSLNLPDAEQTAVPEVDAIDLGGVLDSLGFGEGGEAPVSAPVPEVSGQDEFLDQFIKADGDYNGLLAQGDNPAGDKPEAGFFSGIAGGAVGLMNTVGVPLMVAEDAFSSYINEEFPGTPFASWISEKAQEQRGRVQARDEYIQDLPSTKTLQEIGEADSAGEIFDAIMDSDTKWSTFKEFAGMVLPSSAAFAGGAVLQGLKGAFGTSFILDWGDSYRESLSQGKSKDDALWSATAKSLTQAGVDTLTMGVGRKTLAVGKYKDLFLQTGVQMFGGGFAEQAKHTLVGEKTTAGKVFLEAAGEGLGTPLDIAGIRSYENRGKKARAAFEELQQDLKVLAEDAGLAGDKKDIEYQIEQLEERLGKDGEETETLPKVAGLDLKKGQTEAGVLESVVTGAGVSELTQLGLQQSGKVYDAEGNLKPFYNETFSESSVVIAADPDRRNGLLQDEAKLALMESQLANQELLKTESPEALAQMGFDIETMRVAVADTKAVIEVENRVMERSQELVKAWVDAFAPGMKVVVSPGSFGTILSTQAVQEITQRGEKAYASPEAYETALRNARGYDIRSPEAGSTRGQFFNLPNGVSVIELDTRGIVDDSGNVKTSDFVETVAHEFGHALMSQEFLKADQKVRNALLNGYKKWLKRLLKAKKISRAEFYKVHSPAARASLYAEDTSIFRNSDPYWFSFNEYLANQFAKSVGNNKLVGTVVEKFFAKVKELLKKLFKANVEAMPEQSFTDFVNLMAAKKTLSEINEAQASADVATQEQVQTKVKAVISGIMESSILKGRKKLKGQVEYDADNLNADMDTYNVVVKHGVTLLQIGKLNGHIVGLQRYIKLIKGWWNTKMQQTARADERLQQWNDLKPKDAANLGRFMQELTVLSYDGGKKFDSQSEEFLRLAEKFKMSDEMLALADLIDQDFSSVLEELEAVQVEDAKRTFTDEVERAGAIQEIGKTFEELRGRNFFPLSRFGEWFTRIRAQEDMMYDGVEYKAGETITFETFESRRDMKKRQKIFRNKKKYLTEGGLMNDTQKQFAGFPPQFLTMLKERLELNEVQKGEFEDLIHDLAPGKSFTKHMKNRKNTPGFSTDAVRSYANYFLHFGNYVARIKYKGVLQDAINEVGDSAKIINKRTGDGSKRTRIQQYMEDHYEAAMNPGNELANLRAVGFLWYLGFVPKSAVMNLTQVLLVTYPHLAAKYGDAEAVTALTRATKDAAKYWLNPKKMGKGQMDMIYELIQTGIIDESMATELAAASEGSLLNRITPGNVLGSEKAARAIRRMAGAGAWMFQKAEKMNRRVTALAAYDLALQAGATHAQAVEAARDAIETTQFEYARWNRPKFMRGKKSVMFLFWMYMQNSLFFIMKDPGRLRYVMMMFLFAGLSGLPFAEDAMDLYDYITKKLNKRFGEDFSDTNIRLSAAEFIKELGANPDLVMHGASRYSFGMSALGDLVGLPIPNADMSGSLSMGNIIPGFGELLSDRPFNDSLGKATEAVGGAVVAMPIQLGRAIADDNPDTLKRFEKAMPSFMRNFSKAYRYASRGEETLPDGTVVTKFNKDDSKQRMEILLQGAGFTSTRVVTDKVPFYMTKEILNYYGLRRQSLTAMLDYAKRSGDSKMLARTWDEVRKFNKSVKMKGMASMGIRTKNLRRSLKDREKQRQMQERGFVGGRTGAQVTRKVYDAFEEEEVP